MIAIVFLSIGLAAHAASWPASRHAAFTSQHAHASSPKISLNPKNSRPFKSSHNPSTEWIGDHNDVGSSSIGKLGGSRNGEFADKNSYESRVEVKYGSGSRRSFMKSASLSIAGVMSAGPLAASLPRENFISTNNAANAMGLVTFPCPEGSLMNEYHIMRAGQSLLEEQGILSTNQLFLTNRDDALTTLGVIQMEDACADMMAKGINPSVVKYSLASKCIDSANIVATRMMIGRNRIIPEFTFMDPRGVGIWDQGPNEAAIWALDNAEAGIDGRAGRPPANDDGTANETLYEQMIRLRQLMSVLETQYSGDSILLIFPDGTSPALLSALIAGIPLKDAHALNFEPGEVRLGVTMDNTLELFKDRVSSPRYNQMLEVGQKQLETLRHELLLRQAEENAPPAPVPVSTPKRSKADTKPLNSPAEGSDVFAAGAMAAVASMTMLRKGEEDEPNVEVETMPDHVPSLAFANSNGLANATEAHMDMATYYGRSDIVEEEPVLSREERKLAAEAAMAEYLNRDDGGDDWLRSIQEIIDE
ncbi:hypothetical protein ACHAWO_002660 [Cyclotella atomus]|uniref:Uncharacterized protein n=1 Tax=Cyclotella atomus TaxID=382360 RepID=A0ABD3P123_9STRA